MKLGGLVSLYQSMKSRGIDRYRFEYKASKVIFDVFFFTDELPFILLFGVKSESFSFEIIVEKGFIINPQLDKEVYKQLCNALGLKYDPDRPFSPLDFFREFSAKIPNQALISQKAEPHDLAPYRAIAEKPNKIYFCGWKDNTRRGENVGLVNLDKTKKLMGEKVYQRCRQKNISSCWTDKKNRAKEVTMP